MSTNLTKAFRELRKLGFIARQNFMCCQTCGAYKISSMIKKDKKNKVKGYVFYHSQDDQNRIDGYDFYLSFSGNTISTKDTGMIICYVLNKNGVKHEWDGDEYIRIKIIQE